MYMCINMYMRSHGVYRVSESHVFYIHMQIIYIYVYVYV